MDTPNSQEPAHLKDYLDVLRRRKEAVIIFFLSTVLITTVASFVIEPVYRSTVTLMIDVESPNVLTTSGSVALDSQNYYSYKDYLQTQMEVITSRPIIRAVFGQFDLSASKEYRQAPDPVKKFTKTISVEPLRDTRLIELRVDNKDPKLAAKIANTIAQIYVRRNLAYISKNELLNLLKNEYLKLQSKLSEYAKIYKSEHPEMIKLKQEIAELVGKMEQEKNLISSYGVNPAGDKDVSQDALGGLKANNVSIVEPAEVPVTPVSPKKPLNILLSVLLGSFGGIALAFFLEYLDDTVKEVEEIEKLTRLPILGSVPDIGLDKKINDLEKDNFVQNNPKDPISEAYRSFRTSIFFSSTPEHPLKSLLISSPGPGEGKTITLCNLGIAVAQNNKKVLLVDGDMRKPRLNDIFKKDNKAGLSNFLSGKAPFEGLIQKTSVENLFLVPSGPIPPNPAELLASAKLKDFINIATEKFDLVIFDSPPIAMLADPLLIARDTEGMIMVIESGKTSKRALERISSLLKEAKARVIGTFLNKLPRSNKNYYYYSYYSRYEK
jgi:capsular exopolysaccharide synthesis family protein